MVVGIYTKNIFYLINPKSPFFNMKFILAYRLQNDLEEVLSFLDKLHFTWNTGRS